MPHTAKLPRAIILVPVFVPAVVITVLLVVGTMSNPQLAGELFDAVLAYITRSFGWFYMLSVAFFLVFIVGIALTKWGNIKLGPDHAEPQYSFPAWFAMLFSAGYGIALLFFGVAEPVLHYSTPPDARRKRWTRPSRRCRSPSSTGVSTSGASLASSAWRWRTSPSATACRCRCARRSTR